MYIRQIANNYVYMQLMESKQTDLYKAYMDPVIDLKKPKIHIYSYIKEKQKIGLYKKKFR